MDILFKHYKILFIKQYTPNMIVSWKGGKAALISIHSTDGKCPNVSEKKLMSFVLRCDKFEADDIFPV